MTSNVLTVRPDASIAEMVKLMLDHRISGLPVVDDRGNLVGIAFQRGLSAPYRDRHRTKTATLAVMR
jgi:CBS domain-containing protein